MKTPRSARTTTAIAVTHHMKTSRRHHGLPSHFEMSLRFTTLFILAIFVCEFSGLSQAVADAYTKVALRFSSSFTSSTSSTTHQTSSHTSSSSSSSSSASSSSSTSSSSSISVSPTPVSVVTSFHHTITSSVVAVSPLTSGTRHFDIHSPPDQTPFSDYYAGFEPDATVSQAMSKKGLLLRLVSSNSSSSPSSSNDHDHPPAPTTPKKPTFALETFWSRDDMDIKVCRIHNACIRASDNAVLVHSKLRRYAGPLRECNVRKLDYFENAEAQYDAKSPTSGYDLYGAAPARYHIPHFLTDILPVLFSSELIWPSVNHPSAKNDCVDPAHRKCDRVSDTANAALFIEHRVLNMKVSSWVPQFAALMPGAPYLLSPEVMHGDIPLDDGSGEGGTNANNANVKKPKDGNKKNNKLACFKSVVSFPRHTYMLRSPEWFAEGNAMFNTHGLSRASLRRMSADEESVDSVNQKAAEKSRLSDKSTTQEPRAVATPCPVHVVFVNRIGWEVRHGVYLGRDIVNMDEVRASVIRMSKDVRKPEVELITSVHYFENLTFAQQVRIMQAADVLVGVHGAGLSNVVFARRETPLLEVFPFSYYAGPFGGVANSLGLKYTYTVAKPDTKTFLDCVELKAKKADDDSVLPKVKDIWRDALTKRKMEGNLDSLKTHTMRDFVGSIMKMCARSQRLVVDPTELATTVLKMAQNACGADVEF